MNSLFKELSKADSRPFPRRISFKFVTTAMVVVGMTCLNAPTVQAQIAVRGKTVYTMAGQAIVDGVVLIKDGRIAAVGPANRLAVPEGYKLITATIVTPGLIDAHGTAGLSGVYNQPHDQDQLDKSGAIQPELRAMDAINIREELIAYLRSYGVTTLHTGNATGELVSGQTMITKTVGSTIEESMLVDTAAIVGTLGPRATRTTGSPGTRSKQMAMLRQELIKAQEYMTKLDDAQKPKPETTDESDEKAKDKSPQARDLRLEALARVLKREIPLMITANKAQDIATALRIAKEFNIRLWLDGAAESYLMVDEIKAAEVPVFLHPTMSRAVGEYENLSFETASKLVAAGIPVTMQSGFEGYVPKTRVVLFEAAITAANGLTFEQALATITSDAARVLGIADRVGTLEVGKDADLALYDGDPFEYTTHCTGVIINGQVVNDTGR